MGISFNDLETRARAATYQWLLGQFDEAAGAFHGHYRVPVRYFEPPQTVNLIAPWQLLAMAQRAAVWFYRYIVDHPMSVVAGACAMAQ